ncbi:hypothetical protein TPL01_08720 [Sulfuriferula plumbiphila]|uniref:Transcriptional initiation protein Tat n=1 Tax=Sulfuriferula plumbiphila TaxID=171865 RepID=A0A512L5I8_9PROT|nr:transcriptional initiation protein Tat [Sulfuriferula plumbiphila]BBP03495.1 hypothetical protein SFPGR_09170 [Sulfuriferula plumbiphila]GEP29734.1 hypothetical protein TPL01_08720 [Sulfuriferula plumbiphila]
MDQKHFSRRDVLRSTLLGLGIASLSLGVARAAGSRVQAANLLAPGAKTLQALNQRLAVLPRRRDFKTVPMILNAPHQWDSKAFNEVLQYTGGPKQVWDNTDLAGPWLNLMRNAMNAQIWAFRHPDFLAVSATHGSAHLALYDEMIWDKYGFAKLSKDKFKTNTFLAAPLGSKANPADYENTKGVFSPYDNSITVLQKRGVVFLACHNEIWEVTMDLHNKGVNPDHLSHEQMAAEFTNHLIPGVILTPGVVGTLVELQNAGYHYAT